jgi:hypothetical protein
MSVGKAIPLSFSFHFQHVVRPHYHVSDQPIYIHSVTAETKEAVYKLLAAYIHTVPRHCPPPTLKTSDAELQGYPAPHPSELRVGTGTVVRLLPFFDV